MTVPSRRSVAFLVAAALGAAALGLAPAGAGATTRYRSTYSQHPMAHHRTDVAPHLSYLGGHVLSRVKVDVVVWGRWSYSRSVPLTGGRSISSFFSAITASPYVSWLSEYDTPSQTINHGTLEGVYTVRPPSSADGSTVTSSDIASTLHTMMHDGRLPRPTSNRLFVVFFRSGQTILSPDGSSATDFCAYHDTMQYTSATTAYFAVIPYEIGHRGCQPASTSFDDVTTIVSHELVEAITDPGVGLGKVAWYDRNFGEIGDICAGVSTPATVVGGDGVGYVVQREWSNRARACIATR